MNTEFEFMKSLQRAMAIRTFVKQRTAFYEELAEALADGEALARFFSDRAARAVVQKDPLALLYKAWLRRMDQPGSEGGRLSYVLRGFAPVMDLMVISSFDTGQHIASGLEFLASTIKKQQKMRAVLIAALAVPALILAMVLVFFIVNAYMVVPVFLSIAPPKDWGTVGYGLYLASIIVTHYGVVVAMLLAGLVWAFVWSLPNWSGSRRVQWDRRVPYRIFRDYNAATFLVAVAMMLNAGQSLHLTMEELKKRSSPWLRWHINRISRGLNRASGAFGEAFNTGLLAQPIANRLTDSSRRSPKFHEVVTRIGVDGLDKTAAEVEKSAKRMNTILFICMGILVGTMILGTMRTGQVLAEAMQQQVNKQKSQVRK